MKTETLAVGMALAMEIDRRDAAANGVYTAARPLPCKPGRPWFRWPEKTILCVIAAFFAVGLVSSIANGNAQWGFLLLLGMSLHFLFIAWLVMRAIYLVPVVFAALFP